MLLRQRAADIHLSHLHCLVSAYETNDQTVKDLIESINAAVKKAKETREVVVVDQDGMDHVFHVHPSGRVSLYRLIQTYEIVDP